MRLDEIKSYFNHMRTYLESPQRPIDEGEHIDEKKEFYRSIFENHLPFLLYTSTCLAIVISLEVEIKEFFQRLFDKFSLNCYFNDRRGRGSFVEKFKKYSEKVANLSISYSQVTLEDVQEIFEIRNCLVHAGGDLDNFKKKNIIERFFCKNNLNYPENNQLMIDKKIIDIFIKHASRFLEEIYDAAHQKYHENRQRQSV